MITKKEWRKHSKNEQQWWGDCINTGDEEIKQLTYAEHMGLNQFNVYHPDRRFGAKFDLQGKSILDIGGGPVSLLLKSVNFSRGVVLDPLTWPEWVMDRYEAAGIEYVQALAEEAKFEEGSFDEVWIYNVLQHTWNPTRIIKKVLKWGKVIRLFEWIDTVPEAGHPYAPTIEFLNEQFGTKGKVIDMTKWRGYPRRAYALALGEPVRGWEDYGYDGKFRFHLLGLAHVPTHKEISMCAYTGKILKLSKMLMDLGHTVYFYGGEGSDVECTEFIEVVSDADRIACYGDYNWRKEFFKHDGKDSAYQMFNENAIPAINARKKTRDFLLCSMGNYQKPIADAVGLMTVESGIGYRGVFSNKRVFESYTWMHYVYGLTKQNNGNWYDCVIPNYFDPEDFRFQPKKDDYFLYIGRLCLRKGLDIATQVTRELGAKLIVAGQGSLVNPAERLNITDSHVEHIGSVGPFEREEMMGRAKAAFVPTYFVEPFGGVAVEAQMCIVPGQLILGEIPKAIDRCTDGEMVQTGTGQGVVEQTFMREYDGEICRIKGMGLLPFDVTPKHPILIAETEMKYHPELERQGRHSTKRAITKVLWKDAESIVEGDHLMVSKSNSSQEAGACPSTIDLAEYTIVASQVPSKKPFKLSINEDTMRLFGYHVAEGCTANQCLLIFGPHESGLAEDAMQIITEYTPYKPYIRHKNAALVVAYGGNVLARFYEANFNKLATGKWLPQWVLNAPLPLLKAFLGGYLAGDGSMPGGALSASTSSLALALQLQQAFLRFGMFMPLIVDRREGHDMIEGRRVNRHRSYMLTYRRSSPFNPGPIKAKRTSYFHLEDDKYIYTPVRKVEAISYTGPVYNLKTSDGTFLLSNAVVHNCGTPVITSDWGAFAETVLDGVTGFRCRTFNEFVQAAQNIDRINPQDCRDWAIQNYSMDRVKWLYQAYFEQLYDIWLKPGEVKHDGGWYRHHDEDTGHGRYQKWYPEACSNELKADTAQDS